MKKSVIYARVSSVTDRQSTERQIISLGDYARSNDYEVVKVFSEHISGATKNAERQALNQCIDYAVANKTDILISELSRMGRAIWEVLESVKRCVDHKVNVVFQKEGLQLFDADGQVNSIMAVYVSCLALCAEKEREAIRFRLHQGRELAKQKGVRMGRPSGSIKSREQKEQEYGKVIRLLRKGESLRNTAKLCDVSLSTVIRVKKEFSL
ncbi:MAG: recombinase family protein [Bacteroidales bacterium]|nr:recombinase family protein [Bacteroidales bacterium]